MRADAVQLGWIPEERYCTENNDTPKKPCAGVGSGPILAPRTEVVAAGETLPARPPARHAEVLAEEQSFGLAAVTVAEVRQVDVACNQTQF